MNADWKYFGILAFLILLSFTVTADVLVQVKPDRGVEVLELYPSELGVFQIKLTNEGLEPVTAFHVEAHTSPGLDIVEGSNVLVSKLFEVPVLEPGREYVISLEVRPQFDALTYSDLDNAVLESRQILVNVNYGLTDFTQFTGTVVRVIPSPVRSQLNLNNQKPAPYSKGVAIPATFVYINQSAETLTNAQLHFSYLPDYLDVNVKSVSLGDVFANEFVDSTVEFVAEPSAQNKSILLTEFEFSDSRGVHILQWPLELEFAQDMPKLEYLLIAAVLIVLMYFVWTRKNKKPKQNAVNEKGHAEHRPAETESAEHDLAESTHE